jgi:hypothetical protein
MSTLPRIASRLFHQQFAFRQCFTCYRQHVWSNPRSISTTLLRNAALATKPPAHPTVVLFSPSAEYLQKEELDVQVLQRQDINLIITDRAAEVMWSRCKKASRLTVTLSAT